MPRLGSRAVEQVVEEVEGIRVVENPAVQEDVERLALRGDLVAEHGVGELLDLDVDADRLQVRADDLRLLRAWRDVAGVKDGVAACAGGKTFRRRHVGAVEWVDAGVPEAGDARWEILIGRLAQR